MRYVDSGLDGVLAGVFGWVVTVCAGEVWGGMVRAVGGGVESLGSFDCASRDETARGFAQDDTLLMEDVFDLASGLPYV